MRPRIFFSPNAAHQRYLEAKGFQAHRLEDIANIPLGDSEIVVVDFGDQAKESAHQLADRGIDPSRLSYIDVQQNQDPALLKPKHIHWDDVVWLSELDLSDRDFEVYPSGLGFLDMNLGWGWRIPELVVVAGPYGCGKSTFGQILAANFVHGAGRALESGAMLCSWEDLDVEVYRNIGNFAQANDAPDMHDRIAFVRRDASEDRLVQWYMDLVRYHKKRYGTRFFFLDPWNEMDHQRNGGQSETEYTRDIMKELRRLVDSEKIILIIATHISAKYMRGNGEIEPFKIGHAFGSSQFGNKADRGICLVHSRMYDHSNGHAIIRLDKAKVQRRMGRKGTVAARLDPDRFALEYDAHVTGEVQGIWKD